MKSTLFGILCILAIGIVGAINVSLQSDINSIRRELDMMDAGLDAMATQIREIESAINLIDEVADLHTKQLKQSSKNERMLAENDESILLVLQEMVRQLSQHHRVLERLMRVRGYKMEV